MGSTDHDWSAPSRREHDEDDERRRADVAACWILDPALLPTERLGHDPLAPFHRRRGLAPDLAGTVSRDRLRLLDGTALGLRRPEHHPRRTGVPVPALPWSSNRTGARQRRFRLVETPGLGLGTA